MTGLNSWLSPAVLHALGWALIHSLWQCAGVAALAALAMAFIRRPAVRYLVGVGALALMLAAPVATFLVLAKPAAPAPVLQPAPMPASVLPVTPPPSTPVAVFATADRAIGAIAEAPRQLPAADMLPWLVAAWACGVAFFSLRFAGGFLLLEHRRRTQSHNPGERVLALCLDLQRRLGLDRAIQYLECGWVEAPAVIGWLRPAVLMPVFALTGLSEEQFRAVIAHELAHIRRHDWLVNLFQVLVETLLFYHPAMWWLNRRIRIERELCCDEIAVSLTGSRLEYARALAQMAEWKNVSMLAMAANRGPLTQRILHVLGRGAPGAGQRVAGLTGGMLFLVAALAAANLLFGIAYPIPAAKAEVRAVLVSSQNAALRMARQVFAVSGPAAKIAEPTMAAPDKVEVAADAQPENLAAPSPDLSQLLPSENLTTPTVLASNAASPIPAPTNGAAAANDSPKVFHCLNTSVFGRVVSAELIEMQGFACNLNSPPILFGACPWASSYSYPGDPAATQVGNPSRGATIAPVGRLKTPKPECEFDSRMNVRLANPADGAKMQPGKLVRLAGEFQVARQNGKDYLSVANARVTWADPFDPHAANDTLATPAQSLPNAASAVALNDQPVAPPTHDVGLVQAVSSTPPPVMAAPMAGLSPPVTGTEPALACLLGLSHWLCQHDLFAMRAMMSFPRGVSNCVDDRHPNAWPKHPAFDSRCPQGVLEAVDYLGRNARGDDVYRVQYSHSITTYVLRQPNPDGKVEEYWNRNIPSYMTAVPSQNVHKVALYRRPAQWSDPTDRHAANAPPAATPDNQPITLASAVAPGRASAPRTRTEPALACLLGFAPRECLNAFDLKLKQRVSWQIITCVDIGSVRHSYCPDGPVEAVNYLGANAAGADVYEVQCSHGDSVYVIEPPDANEKINHLWIKSGNLNAIVPSSLVAITSRAGAGLIYKKTATDGGAQADPTDRHAGDFQITRRDGTD
jgi:beta-lactamase regulating signal transducer with metallopeptidase domain